MARSLLPSFQINPPIDEHTIDDIHHSRPEKSDHAWTDYIRNEYCSPLYPAQTDDISMVMNLNDFVNDGAGGLLFDTETTDCQFTTDGMFKPFLFRVPPSPRSPSVYESPLSTSSDDDFYDDFSYSPYSEFQNSIGPSSPSPSYSSIVQGVESCDISGSTLFFSEQSSLPSSPSISPTTFRDREEIADVPTVTPSDVYFDLDILETSSRSVPLVTASLPPQEADTLGDDMELEDVSAGLRSPAILVSFDLPETRSDQCDSEVIQPTLLSPPRCPRSSSATGLIGIPERSINRAEITVDTNYVTLLRPDATTHRRSKNDSTGVLPMLDPSAILGVDRQTRRNSSKDSASPHRYSPYRRSEVSLVASPLCSSESLLDPGEKNGHSIFSREHQTAHASPPTRKTALSNGRKMKSLRSGASPEVFSRPVADASDSDSGESTDNESVGSDTGINMETAGSSETRDEYQDVCKAVVASENVRNASELRRTRPAKFFCPRRGCDAGFTAKHNLKHHEDVHNGLRPHECDICHRTFTTRATCRRHMKIIHSSAFAAQRMAEKYHKEAVKKAKQTRTKSGKKKGNKNPKK
ncbi:putative zinc finger and SCAN domain-containing protein 5C [Hypsizygus marmoreus]|uniref:Zinc finger and SCAN domain-containing protein 5C n=1 Tax=Hypsizygus marmoreus TaxID=39966 RepID=A0A369K476_HYPMA|nr:putative zinc finger and SCAN domain-containing protein 5C [Hypsizygus marmoreus]